VALSYWQLDSCADILVMQGMHIMQFYAGRCIDSEVHLLAPDCGERAQRLRPSSEMARAERWTEL